MPTFADKLFAKIRRSPGLSDRELTNILCGVGTHPAQVNQAARLLEGAERIVRRPRVDGIIGNYPAGAVAQVSEPVMPEIKRTRERLSEDEIKEFLDAWLRSPVSGLGEPDQMGQVARDRYRSLAERETLAD